MNVITIVRDKYTEEDFNNWIDECYDKIKLFGTSYLPSTLLKNLDPIAYDCAFSDYQIEEVRFICDHCGDEYEDEEEAEECCKEALDYWDGYEKHITRLELEDDFIEKDDSK